VFLGRFRLFFALVQSVFPKGKSRTPVFMPDERRVLYQLLRVEGTLDRKAVDSVVSQFWAASAGGLVNPRAAAEIGKAKRQVDVNRQIAFARERKRRQASRLPGDQEERDPKVSEVDGENHDYFSIYDENGAQKVFQVDCIGLVSKAQAINGLCFALPESGAFLGCA
jgi:uncharacterized protein YdaU (DUF1376 family)